MSSDVLSASFATTKQVACLVVAEEQMRLAAAAKRAAAEQMRLAATAKRAATEQMRLAATAKRAATKVRYTTCYNSHGLWRQHGADLPVQVVHIRQGRLVPPDLGLVGGESDLERPVEVPAKPHQVALHDLLVHCPTHVADGRFWYLPAKEPAILWALSCSSQARGRLAATTKRVGAQQMHHLQMMYNIT